LRLDPAFHHPARAAAAAALRASPFPLRTVAELCEVRNEAVVPSQELPDEELTYLGLANIEAHTGRCSPEVVGGVGLKSAVRRALAGDILFAKMRPELRKVCLLPPDLDEAYASAECLVLVPRRDATAGRPAMLPELLAALLRSDLAYGQVVHLVTGIGRPRLNRAAVMDVRLPCPPPGEQRRLLRRLREAEVEAEAVRADSRRAAERADRLATAARDLLVRDLLAPGSGGRHDV
jgi:hypothetical protein